MAQPGLPEVIRLRPPAETPVEEEEKAAVMTEENPAPAPAPAPLRPPPNLVGEWTLAVAGRSTSCRITLSNQRAEGEFQIASLGSNCPMSLFSVTRWHMSGGTLSLASRAGRILARLQPVDADRPDGAWQGPTSDGPDAMMEKLGRR